MMKKFPPKQKILEAFTAIADNHVKVGDNEATVTSSDEVKTYTVTFHDDVYTSNDNATYWQGYAGYPVLAVLMLQGRLTTEKSLVNQFANVDWHAINKANKRKYDKAAEEVINERGLDEDTVNAAMDKDFAELKALPLTIKRGSIRPPKAKK